MAEKVEYTCTHLGLVNACYDKNKYNITPTDSMHAVISEFQGKNNKKVQIGTASFEHSTTEVDMKPLANGNRARSVDMSFFGSNELSNIFVFRNIRKFNVDGGGGENWYNCFNCEPNSMKNIENDFSNYPPQDPRSKIFKLMDESDPDYISLRCQYYPKICKTDK